VTFSRWAAALLLSALVFPSICRAGTELVFNNVLVFGPYWFEYKTRMVVEPPNVVFEFDGRDTPEEKIGRMNWPTRIIYRGDRRTLVVVNDRDRSWTMISSDDIPQVRAKLREDVEATARNYLASVPRAQRKSYEPVLRKWIEEGTSLVGAEIMPGNRSLLQRGLPSSLLELDWGYVWPAELWVTDWQNIPGGKPVETSVKEFVGYVREVFAPHFERSRLPLPVEAIAAVEGFPVIAKWSYFTENFTSCLLTVEERKSDPNLITPPESYEVPREEWRMP